MPKLILKRAALGIATVAAISLGAAVCWIVLGRSHLYHGPTSEPAAWNPGVERSKIVAEARKLIGLWYDPAQGYLNNAGGKLGMIVCMDVPRLAYRNAGASIKRLLEADFRSHPEHYGEKVGRPGDPYFDRRARNLFSFCKHNGFLDLNGPPEPGDVVFMSRSPTRWVTHIALVSDVDPSGRYRVVEASRDEWYLTREEAAEKMLARGWIFRGYGKPLRHGGRR